MNASRALPAALSPEDARRAVDLRSLSFTSTAELEPLTTLVGQERAMQALRMGLGMTQQGYNIFICGFEGTGCTGPNYRLLRVDAASLPTPRRLGLRA